MMAPEISNNFISTIFARRSVKPSLMTGEGPDDQAIDTLIKAAIAAPDHGKLQPWRFFVIRGEGRKELGKIMAEALAKRKPDSSAEQRDIESQKPLRAPVIIVVISSPKPHPTIPESEQLLSAGAASENILLAAQSMGYASKWLTGKACYDPYVLKALGVKDQEKIVAMIYLGQFTGDLPGRDEKDPKAFYQEWPIA